MVKDPKSALLVGVVCSPTGGYCNELCDWRCSCGKAPGGYGREPHNVRSSYGVASKVAIRRATDRSSSFRGSGVHGIVAGLGSKCRGERQRTVHPAHQQTGELPSSSNAGASSNQQGSRASSHILPSPRCARSASQPTRSTTPNPLDR